MVRILDSIATEVVRSDDGGYSPDEWQSIKITLNQARITIKIEVLPDLKKNKKSVETIFDFIDNNLLYGSFGLFTNGSNGLLDY